MTGKQRAQFRAAANGLEPVFQIGKGGVTDAVIAQVDTALRKRELIKVKALLESAPQPPKEMAVTLSEATGSEVIQVIGGCIILYRENPELREAEKAKEKRQKVTKKIQKFQAKNPLFINRKSGSRGKGTGRK